jgi:hypothetical protein
MTSNPRGNRPQAVGCHTDVHERFVVTRIEASLVVWLAKRTLAEQPGPHITYDLLTSFWLPLPTRMYSVVEARP